VDTHQHYLSKRIYFDYKGHLFTTRAVVSSNTPPIVNIKILITTFCCTIADSFFYNFLFYRVRKKDTQQEEREKKIEIGNILKTLSVFSRRKSKLDIASLVKFWAQSLHSVLVIWFSER